jgi:hypothetical protein
VRAIDQLKRPDNEIISECVDLIIDARCRNAAAKSEPICPSSTARMPLSVEDQFVTLDASADPAEIADLKWPDFDQDIFSTTFEVRAIIQFLRTLNSEPWQGNQAENAAAITKVCDQLRVLRETLADIPKGALVMLFSKLGTTSETIPLRQLNAIPVRLRKTLSILRLLEMRCEQLISDPPGVHGNLDFRQRLAAEEGWDLLRRHGIRPTSTGTGLYHQVTVLLHEAMTGQTKADMVRAIRTVFDERKSLRQTSRKKIRKSNSQASSKAKP